MGVTDRLRELFRPAQERAITPQQLFSTGLDDLFVGQSATGIHVTTELAMQAAIGACVRLLADDISTLPVDTFRKVGDESVPVPRPAWLERPSGSPWDNVSTLVSDFVVSMGTDGNTFLMGTPNLLDIETIEVLDPKLCDIDRGAGARRFLVNGVEHGEDRVMHVPWLRMPGRARGINIVEASRETSGLELAAREWAARFFGNGATVCGVIQFPAGSIRPSTEEVDELRKQFAMRHQGRRKSHAFGVLYGGAQYNPMTLKPQEAELMPLWRHVLEEAARIYHIPPHLLASQDPGGASYSSVEQRSIEYVIHGVTTFTTRIERALSRLIPGDDTFLRINVNGLLRGDIKSRAEWYGIALDKKVMRRSEVRQLEDLPPDPEADAYLETPNNNSASTEAADRSLSVSVNDGPTSLHLDSVAVSEAGVERIAEASTAGIAAGIAVLSSDMARDSATLADVFTGSLTRVEESTRSLSAEMVELKARLDAAEEREARRTAPVQFDIRRDERGRPTEVFVRQGERITRKRVRHDDNGRVVGVTEEALA